MGLDRFVYWSKTRPSLPVIRKVLEDYLDAALKELHVDGSLITVLLHGKPSFPFKRIRKAAKFRGASEAHPERWFEAYCTYSYVDVITRMTDEYTNVVAEGFAALAARFWKGRRED